MGLRSGGKKYESETKWMIKAPKAKRKAYQKLLRARGGRFERENKIEAYKKIYMAGGGK